MIKIFTYIKLRFRENWLVYLVVYITLLVVGIGYMISQIVNDEISIQSEKGLEENWRYQYDILVLPNDKHIGSELDDGWVAPQSSISNYGGIKLQDVELISNIPGVEIAAPIALIGYFDYNHLSLEYADAEPGSYHEVHILTSAFDGLKQHNYQDHSFIHEYYHSDFENSILHQRYGEEVLKGFRTYVAPTVSLRNPNEMMLVAIDPAVEEQLYSISSSIISGEGLLGKSVSRHQNTPLIPIIALADQQYDVSETVTISEINIPIEFSNEDIEDGVANFLAELPRSKVMEVSLDTFSPELRYKNVQFSYKDDQLIEENYHFQIGERDLLRYSPIHYSLEYYNDNEIPQLKAKTVPPPTFMGLNMDFPRYRSQEIEREFVSFGVDIIGLFDANKIEPLLHDSWNKGEPLDIYTPHHSMIIRDGQGVDIEPTPLIPLPPKDTYYSGAPDAITTIDALRIFYNEEDAPISSIRVVVDGVDERSQVSQRKIEQIAKNIMEETEYRVEIMLGSSASRVHVNLGGESSEEIGVVEEGWFQKGVSWEIEEQISTTNKLLFIYLLSVSSIFCLTVTNHSLLKRSPEFSMLRSIGWSRNKVLGILIMEVLVLSLSALGIIIFINNQFNQQNNLDYGFLLILFVTINGTGYFLGSRRSLWEAPKLGLSGDNQESVLNRFIPISGLGTFVLNQLVRRPLRFALLVLTICMSTFMLILFLATQQSLSNYLYLSFLGESIDLNLATYQQFFWFVGLSITLLIAFLLIFLNMIERREELFIFKSLGWTSKKIVTLLSIEAIIYSIFASFLGTVSGYIFLSSLSLMHIPLWIFILTIFLPSIIILLFNLNCYYFTKSHDKK